jgi:hypothetical protein
VEDRVNVVKNVFRPECLSQVAFTVWHEGKPKPLFEVCNKGGVEVWSSPFLASGPRRYLNVKFALFFLLVPGVRVQKQRKHRRAIIGGDNLMLSANSVHGEGGERLTRLAGRNKGKVFASDEVRIQLWPGPVQNLRMVKQKARIKGPIQTRNNKCMWGFRLSQRVPCPCQIEVRRIGETVLDSQLIIAFSR